MKVKKFKGVNSKVEDKVCRLEDGVLTIAYKLSDQEVSDIIQSREIRIVQEIPNSLIQKTEPKVKIPSKEKIPMQKDIDFEVTVKILGFIPVKVVRRLRAAFSVPGGISVNDIR